MQFDRSYLQAHKIYIFFFFHISSSSPSPLLLCRPDFKPVIQCECRFWQSNSTTSIIMFLPHRVGFWVWPHFRASTSEMGHVSNQSMFKCAFQGLPIFVDKSFAAAEFIKVLSKLRYCLWWPHFRVQGLFGCDHYVVWQSSAHIGPGKGISHNLHSDWLT